MWSPRRRTSSTSRSTTPAARDGSTSPSTSGIALDVWLPVPYWPAAASKNFALKAVADLGGQGGVATLLVGLAQQFSRPGEDHEVVVVGRRAGQGDGGELGRAVRAGPEVAPIAQPVRDDVPLGAAGEIIDVADHPRPVLFEHPPVAVASPGEPRVDDARAAPLGESRKPPSKTVYSGAMSGTSPSAVCDSRSRPISSRTTAARRS